MDSNDDLNILQVKIIASLNLSKEIGKKIKELEEKQSKEAEEFGIQLADVFASALCFALTPREDKFVKYQDKIKSLPIFQNIKLNIAPSTNDFIEERMKETAEIDPLDFLCKHNIDISTEQN